MSGGKLKPNGRIVSVNGHNLHVYAECGFPGGHTLVFMSGAGTFAPVYDFKPLWSLLARKYNIAVVEKLGYGYSDIADVPRDLDSILEDTRGALSLCGIAPPYILFPHSMSGLEALYYAGTTDEIAGIVGLDMATPGYYKTGEISTRHLPLLRTAVNLGIHKLIGVSKNTLTQEEYIQAKLLRNRNAVNVTVLSEAKYLTRNVDTAQSVGSANIPTLLFSSNGRQIGKSWVKYQREYAKEVGAKLIELDCGHYIHSFKAGTIAAEFDGWYQENFC
ncbi:alpha/beta hydrolase [Clostridia bacterium]|nr:alpha/beta hydrolase [Clostridia bacterium]